MPPSPALTLGASIDTMQPEQLGPFRIGCVLGRGGMGAVYEGVHVETGEMAAVKVLLSTLEEDNELRLRFTAEIDTLKRLRHHNIVRLFGFGEEQGMLYYVMELVDGPSLHQEIKRQRLFKWYEVAKIGLEMCLAFKHAHDRGITHRDIKPANILLERQGAVKLSDFGIAHLFGGHRFTEAHSVVGTLEYMSPEQAQANPVGARSDLYSLGAVLYTLLVSHPPFTARNLPEILRKHQTGVVESVRATRLDIPDELELILFDLLKIRPEDRPHNAYLVLKRFQSLLQALVGPPERILVKPMGPDSPIAPALVPINLPYMGDQEQEQNNDVIIHPQGFVADTGIIDLGGLIDETSNKIDIYQNHSIEDAQTQLVLTVKQDKTEDSKIAEQSTPLADSFGRLDRLQTEQQTLEMSNPIHLDSKLVITDSFSVSVPQPVLPIDANIVMDKKLESIEQDHSPSDKLTSGITQSCLDIPLEIYGFKTEQKNTEQKIKYSDNSSLFRPEIRHGEILFEDGHEMRRSKDEPIPYINVFGGIQQNQQPDGGKEIDEKKEDAGKTAQVDLAPLNTKNDDIAENGKSTVNGLSTNYLPGRGLPLPPPDLVNQEPNVLTNVLSEPPVESGKTDEFYDLQQPQKQNSATVHGEKGKNQTIVERPASSSHFTAVKDEAYNEFDNSDKYRPLISLQTVLISLCLILVGVTFYYLLQPISADRLYERIKQTIDEGNDGDEIASSALRSAEDDISSFLLEYPQHPMKDQVWFYKTELDLAKMEQKLKRPQRLANSDMLNPIEQAYMEAAALIKTDPEEAIIKLKAIINVFRSDKQMEDTNTPTTLHLSQSELCVQLATRRLEKLQKTIEAIKSKQLEKIRERLDKADELESTQPERAEAVRYGIIELYQNRLWAKEVVEETRQKLKKTETK